MWWLVSITIFEILDIFFILLFKLLARSIRAWDWYSAECSFVYVSKIAFFGSLTAGRETIYSLLGPDKTFTWNNNLYHTNYLTEINLLTTREQKFSQVAE